MDAVCRRMNERIQVVDGVGRGEGAEHVHLVANDGYHVIVAEDEAARPVQCVNTLNVCLWKMHPRPRLRQAAG